MILKQGDMLLIVHRRLYDKDEARFFVGHVEDYESGIVKLRGHSYVRDTISGLMIEKSDVRTRILSLSSGTLLVYQLPDALDIDDVKFEILDNLLSLTDGKEFKMNLAEHPHSGQI
jgi:hypothetical protein